MKRFTVFLKASCLIVLIFLGYSSIILAANYPFPLNATYPYGVRATAVGGGAISTNNIQTAYNTWKGAYVTSNGCPVGTLRVQSPEAISTYGSNATVSEGIGYGLLLAVYMNDQATFDGIYKYKQAKAATKSPSHLMPWIVDSGGTVQDSNSATDADIDIGFALLMANAQWGTTGTTLAYSTLATAEINDIRSYDIATDSHVKPGDGWDDYTYPCYFIVAEMRVFSTFDSAHTSIWTAAITKAYSQIVATSNASNGLIGEIINTNGTARTDNPCGGTSGCDGRIYGYNSCRMPWRIAMDYCWSGNATAKSYITLLANFFNGKEASLVDGYWVSSGANQGQYHNSAFVGPAGCSLMVSSTYQTDLNLYYSQDAGFNANAAYYNGALEVLTMLFMSGNMPNLMTMGPPQPTGTATPVPSGQLLDDFEQSNTIYSCTTCTASVHSQNNWGGYWYTYDNHTAASPSNSWVWPTAGGSVTLTSKIGDTGMPAGSNYYVRMTGQVGTAGTVYPSCGIGCELAKNATANGLVVDCSGFTGVRFYVKGDGVHAYSLKLMAISTISTGYNDYKYTFIPPATWTQLAFLFTDFTQETGWGTTVAQTTVLKNLQQLNWQTFGQPTTGTNPVDLSLDYIEFYPYMWTPTYTPSPTGTSTYTPTVPPTITPTFGTSELLDDCEDNNDVNNWGGYWYTFDDHAAPNNGTSYAVPPVGGTFTMSSPGANSTSFAARLTGNVTTAYAYGFIGMGTGTNPASKTGTPRNCTGFTGIRFYTKGDGAQYEIKLIADATVNTGSDDYKFNFTAPAAWTQYQLFFTSFTQEGWGTTVPMATVLSKLKDIQWQTIGQPWPSVDLWVDQIQMFPSLGWTPTATKTPLATNTYTVSNTSTQTVTRTNSATATITKTSTPSSTITSSITASNTLTITNTVTGTNSPTITATITPVIPTKTVTPTVTGTITVTNTTTVTLTCSVTSSATITETWTPLPGGTDLLITSMSVTMYPIPACIISGQAPPLGVLVNFINAGNIDAGNFVIDVDGNTVAVSGLKAGATGSVFFSGYTSYLSTVVATIDSTNLVTESNESNNTLSEMLAMPTPPAFCTNTFSNTPTSTATSTVTSTPTDTTTVTRTVTSTVSATSTATSTKTLGNTDTDTPTNTDTPTGVATNTFTQTSAATNTFTQTSTAATDVPSITPYSTNTWTPTDTYTQGPTISPTNTIGGVCLADDCEDNDNVNLFGGYWFSYASGNGATVSPNTKTGGVFTMTVGGSPLSPGYAARITGNVGITLPDYPSAGMGTQLNSMAGPAPQGTGQVTDISNCTGMKFYTKGDGNSYLVKVPYTDAGDNSLTGFNDWLYTFSAPAAWTQITAPFSMFTNQTWGTPCTLTTALSHAKNFEFQTNFYAAGTVAGTIATYNLWIDDVTLYGCTSCPPPASTPAAGTPTFTFTNTVVPSITVTNVPATFTPTNTYTFTYTATAVPTQVNTNTPVPGTLSLTITGETPAGTVNVDNGDNLTIAFTIANQNATEVKVNLLDQSGTTFVSTLLDLTGVYNIGTNSVTVLNSLMTGITANNYVVQVVVNNASLGQSDSKSTASAQFVHSAATVVYTAVATNTYTYTATATYTFTVAPTVTYTPTAAPTDTTLRVVDIMPYPNPFNPLKQDKVTFKFTVTQKNVDRLSLRVYTTSSRLVKEVVYEQSALAVMVKAGKIPVDAGVFKNLANGSYYYVVIVTQNGKEVRSKIDKLVVIK